MQNVQVSTAQTRRQPQRNFLNLNKTLQYIVLIVLLIFSFLVLTVMVNMSFRPQVLILTNFWGLAIPPSLVNYQDAVGQLIGPMLRTLMISAVSITGIVAIACPASYALARMRFPGRQIFFYMILATFMIPGVLLLTPNFILATQLGLRGSIWGVIVFYVAGGQPFAIFLISTFFINQSEEIFEAARIDGASEIQALIRVAIPLAWPILMTVAILNFLSIYSDLIWPSLMLSKGDQTLIMALERFNATASELTTRPNWGVRAAGYTIGTVPQLILFVFAMKYFIQGLTSGALKG
ncbi:MAG: carbohydrate ABC transporter permease [Anaerolineae bacterium]|nr:carbohydrate ABC transporter permease [Anaerolineae bacterium]